MPVTHEAQVALQKAALLLLEPGRGAKFLEAFRALQRDFADCGAFSAIFVDLRQIVVVAVEQVAPVAAAVELPAAEGALAAPAADCGAVASEAAVGSEAEPDVGAGCGALSAI